MGKGLCLPLRPWHRHGVTDPSHLETWTSKTVTGVNGPVNRWGRAPQERMAPNYELDSESQAVAQNLRPLSFPQSIRSARSSCGSDVPARDSATAHAG